MTESLRSVAHVKVLPRRAILSLIGNVQRSSLILEKVTRLHPQATAVFGNLLFTVSLGATILTLKSFSSRPYKTRLQFSGSQQ